MLNEPSERTTKEKSIGDLLLKAGRHFFNARGIMNFSRNRVIRGMRSLIIPIGFGLGLFGGLVFPARAMNNGSTGEALFIFLCP